MVHARAGRSDAVTLLRGYILFSLFRGVAAALVVMVGIAACIELVGQLNDVGSGEYGMREALSYVALRIPRNVFETMPAAALIGSLLSLGNLAVHRELVVMRASGISPWQLLSAVGLAGFGLAVLMALLGESLAPSLGAYASQLRTQAVQDVDLADGQSTWLKEGDVIFGLHRQAGEFGYGGGVLLFELGPEHALTKIARADSAEVDSRNQWVLANYAETSFAPTEIRAHTERESVQSYSLNPDVLALSVVREDLLDTPALQRYIRYLEENDLDARRYQIAYWSRMAEVVSVVLMTVLALPFVFGGLRSAGTGARLLVGLVIGLSYYVISRVLAQSGEVFDLDPRIVAWAPSAALFLITSIALLRVR
jgi:lipopolysaccharide export system permease protein